MTGLADSELYRFILDNLHMAVYVVGRDGKIVFWNDGAERITGYLRQDVIGRVRAENILAETDGEQNDLEGPFAPIVVAQREGKTVQAEVSLRHKSGHRIPVQLWTFPVRNAQGVIVGAAETFEESISIAEWDRRQSKLASYGCIDHASGVLNHAVMQSHLREQLGISQPISALSTMADSLPGLGIVAAVLGVVITMGALGGPPEEIGHKVAAALVGTFLGILLCYGLIGPIAANMGKSAEEEHAYYHVLRVALVAFMKGTPPTVAVEFARRAIPGHVRPSFQDVEKHIKGGGSGGAEQPPAAAAA